MALEVLLGPVVSVTISKVISLADEQINLGVGFKKELKRFRTTLGMIKDLLLHAEQKEATGSSAVKTWLVELREIADEADALMDEIAYEALRRKVAQKQKLKQVSDFFSSSNPVAVRREMASRVKELNVALAELNKQASGLGLQQIHANVPGHREVVQQTHSLLGDSSQVIGREVDAQNIVSQLVESKFDQPLGVVSIVGFGGLGKTTLAKLVCNNDKVKGYFFKLIWVCVSEKFDVPSILGEMLQSLTGGSRSDLTNQDTVVRMIKEELQEKNFLLVLDDVWNVDEQKWTQLRSSLMGLTEKVGSSRVLVTTRLPTVASVMRSVRGSIEQLEDDECWTIIKQQAFGNSPFPQELEAIGKKIATKCRGVPLVANSIGGSLYNCRDEDDWLSIEMKFDATNDAGVLQALKLSFDRLPRPALKQCFVFCSFFPKDLVMQKEMLIQLWMAEGFLNGLDSSFDVEDVGDSCFEDLVSYSFFQDVRRDFYGRIISCKMHDLLHDLAKSISESEILVLEDSSQSDTRDIRHLNLLCAPSMAPTKMREVFSKLHSLFSRVDIFCDVPTVNFERLLVLSFRGADISELPSFIGKLKRLGYLDISETKVKEIPKCISKLYLLQTFKYTDCKLLEKPPGRIGDLVSLKHIHFNDRKHMPTGIGYLTCLRTLQLFTVGQQRGYQIQELENLSQLGGKLRICNLENAENEAAARRAKLCEKKALVELTLEFGNNVSVDQCEHHYDILEGLEPHSDLKGLRLRYYGGKNCPSWMLDRVGTLGELTCLRNLLSMKLYDCPHLERIPSVSLSKKAVLEIRRCRSLESVEVSLVQGLWIEDCEELALLLFGPLATTSLKEMSLMNCDKLESLPMISSLSSLETLWLERCSHLESIGGESLSTSTSLKKLYICRCDALTSIPSLDGLLSLESISISYCRQLKSIDGKDLSSCTSLKELSVRNCGALTSIPSLDGLLSLESLSISDCRQLKSIEGKDLSSSTGLKELTLWNCDALTSIPSLDGLLSLESLSILKVNSIKKESLSLSSCLKKLLISKWPALASLSIERGLSCLVKIYISGCNQLNSISGESLSSATNLKVLKIFNCPALTSIPSLDGLLSLEEIDVFNCQQLKSIDGESLSTSTCLKELSLRKCPALTYIPSLYGLSSLQEITIRFCQHLKSIGVEGLSLSSFTCLKKLCISYCPAVASVSSLHGLSSLKDIEISRFQQCKGFGENFSFSTCLKKLVISNCPGLTSIPILDGLSSLQSLSLLDCGCLTRLPNGLSSLINMTELALGGFSTELEEFPDLSFIQNPNCSVKDLTLVGWEKLKHLPHQIHCLTALTSLTIEKFDGLEALPDWLGNFSSLQSLCIRDCGGLTGLPNGLSSLLHLTSLELGGFSKELEEFPDLSCILHLHCSLEELTLVGWEKLKHLPHQIQCLTALTSLWIEDFDGQEALPDWLGNYSSLESLDISNCKSLIHMPSLEAMQCLSQLVYLSIYNCPKLEARCATESGSEWVKISHISDISIKSNQQNDANELEIGATSSIVVHDQLCEIIVNNNDAAEHETETISSTAADDQQSSLTVAAADEQQSPSTAVAADDQQSQLSVVDDDETESKRTSATACDDGQSE